MSYHYFAYGIEISSDLALPWLMPSTPSGERGGGLSIRAAHLDKAEIDAARARGAFAGVIDGVVTFYAWKGRELVYDPSPEVGERALRDYMLGPVLCVLLRQRGYNVLHASCAVFDGRAVAFIGPMGAGKSTMAEACYREGHSVLTDDVLAIDVIDDRHVVVPGYPQIKLRPDAAAALIDDPERLPWLLPEGGKRLHRVEDGFPLTPVPLDAIYLLKIGEAIRVDPVPSAVALLNLVGNSRGIHTLAHLPEEVKAHFDQCTRLVREVPVFTLERPRSHERLPEVVRCIEREVASRTSDVAA